MESPRPEEPAELVQRPLAEQAAELVQQPLAEQEAELAQQPLAEQEAAAGSPALDLRDLVHDQRRRHRGESPGKGKREGADRGENPVADHHRDETFSAVLA